MAASAARATSHPNGPVAVDAAGLTLPFTMRIAASSATTIAAEPMSVRMSCLWSTE
jgi:hypothetical protein